jgi:hypothetical protein
MWENPRHRSVRGLDAERVEYAGYVADPHWPARSRPPRAGGRTARTPHVRRDHTEAVPGEERDLVPPEASRVRPAMDEQHGGALAMVPHVQGDPVDLDNPPPDQWSRQGLQDGDLVPLSCEHHRHREPADPAANDHDPGHPATPYELTSTVTALTRPGAPHGSRRPGSPNSAFPQILSPARQPTTQAAEDLASGIRREAAAR